MALLDIGGLFISMALLDIGGLFISPRWADSPHVDTRPSPLNSTGVGRGPERPKNRPSDKGAPSQPRADIPKRTVLSNCSILTPERTGIGTDNDSNHSQAQLRRPEDVEWASSGNWGLWHCGSASPWQCFHQHVSPNTRPLTCGVGPTR